MSDALIDALRERVSRRVVTDGSVCARDFGGLRERIPRAVVSAWCEDDLVAIFEVAREFGVTVTVRGAGHSFLGQSLDDGIVVCNVSEADERDVARQIAGFEALSASAPQSISGEDAPVLLTARSSWRTVERQLNDGGRMCPVLTNHLATTVGGTLSAGGYGLQSLRQGAQIDHVQAVRLVQMDGHARWCTPTENAELFALSLGGYGRVGAIEAVIVGTQPLEPWVAMRGFAMDSLVSMVDAMDDIDSEVEAVVGEATLDGITLRTVRAFADAKVAGAWGAALPARMFNSATPSFRTGYRQLWCDYGLSPANARTFAAEIEDALADPAIRQYLDRVYVLSLHAPSHGRFGPFDIRVPGSDRTVGIGLYFTLHPRDGHGLERVRHAYDVWLRRVLKLGGRPYLQGSHPLEAKDMAALYGDVLRRIETERARSDPQDLLNRNALPALTLY